MGFCKHYRMIGLEKGMSLNLRNVGISDVLGYDGHGVNFYDWSVVEL